MMFLEDASTEQLITICLYEECRLDIKYRAARELQLRRWHDDMLPDLIQLWGKGLSTFDISIELGIEENQVKWQLTKHKLYKKRVPKETWEWVKVAEENGIKPATFRSRHYQLGWT